MLISANKASAESALSTVHAMKSDVLLVVSTRTEWLSVIHVRVKILIEKLWESANVLPHSTSTTPNSTASALLRCTQTVTIRTRLWQDCKVVRNVRKAANVPVKVGATVVSPQPCGN